MDGKFMMMPRIPPIDGHGGPGPRPQYESLSGPTYRLNNVKHSLPDPRVLKPYADTPSGQLDIWPAHASGQAMSSGTSVVLSKNKSLIVLNDKDMGKPQMIPKPKFLDQLETFLKKELRTLGVTKVEPNEIRLQAHREVFEYLIEDFKTYKPLLAAIKNEYEMMLACHRQEIRNLEPLKQMLVTVSEQCDQKIMAIRAQEKDDMINLRSENKRLYLRIEELKNVQKDLEEQVSRLQDELSAEYLKYRDECDARKMLISDVNDLRYQQDDATTNKQNMEEMEEVQEDPVTLKIALRKAREDEKGASQRLNDMIANYGDVIPRRDFEALEAKYTLLDEKFDTSVGDFQKLKMEHDGLLDVYKQVVGQRDEYYLEAETLRRTATPRPEWEKCADYVTGGATRWTELSENKRSNELVDVLLGELSAGGNAGGGPVAYFDPKGTEADVPKFLQTSEPVRNRRLGKRDCILLIKDMWKEKSASDAERRDGTREKLSEFLFNYLKRQFALDKLVIEWGYNLHDCCQRFTSDESISLFWGALNNEVEEEVYHSQLQTVARLMSQFAGVDPARSGKLSKENFKAALLDFDPEIGEESLETIIKAAESEAEDKEATDISYQELFFEDDEGKLGAFLEEVRKYEKRVKLTYIKTILTTLGDVSSVSADDLRIAIRSSDPDIDDIQTDKFLTWVYSCTTDLLSEHAPLDLQVVTTRLENGNLWSRQK